MKCLQSSLLQKQRNILQHREFHFHFLYPDQSLKFFCLCWSNNSTLSESELYSEELSFVTLVYMLLSQSEKVSVSAYDSLKFFFTQNFTVSFLKICTFIIYIGLEQKPECKM